EMPVPPDGALIARSGVTGMGVWQVKRDPLVPTATRQVCFERESASRSKESASVLEGVLGLVAGLLQIGLGLVGLTLGFERLVVSRLADAFFDLTGDVFGGVLRLVSNAH